MPSAEHGSGSQEEKRACNKQQPNSSSSSSAHWDQPISDTQAVELSNYLLTAEEEQEFLATQEESFSMDQFSQESEEAPLSWEVQFNSSRDDARIENWHWDNVSSTWYYGPQFPFVTQIANDPNWAEWLEEVSSPPPQDYYYYLEAI